MSGRRAFLLLVAGLMALNLAPLVAFRFFPSQDGPIHLEMALVLDQLRQGDVTFARYFELNPRLQPNLLVHLPLVPLAKLLTAGAAEKLLLALYVVAFPAALGYALTAVRREALHWLPLAFPLTYSYLLHLGFYNFCYGLALSLLALGYWLRRRDELRGRRAVWLAVWILATGLAHAVALGVLLLVLAVLTGWAIRRERAAAVQGSLPLPSLRRVVLRRLLPLAAGALPPVVLVASFFAGAAAEPAYRMGWVSLVKVLAMLHSLVSFSPWEIAVSLGIGALVAAAAIAALRARRRAGGGWRDSDGLLLAAAAVLLLYFLVPTGFAGGGFFSQRLQLYLLLLVVPCGWRASRRARAAGARSSPPARRSGSCWRRSTCAPTAASTRCSRSTCPWRRASRRARRFCRFPSSSPITGRALPGRPTRCGPSCTRRATWPPSAGSSISPATRRSAATSRSATATRSTRIAS